MQHVESGYLPPEVEILFHRIDKKVIEEENRKIKGYFIAERTCRRGAIISPLYNMLLISNTEINFNCTFLYFSLYYNI